MKRLIFALIFVVFAAEGIMAQGGGVTDAPNHDVFQRTTNSNRKPMSYQFVREADVFWDKVVWREIDLREKKNHPMLYPLTPKNGRQNFSQTIFDAVNSGQLRAFKVSPFGNDEFTLEDQYTEAEWVKRINDSIPDVWINPDDPDDIRDTMYPDPVEPQHIKTLVLKEKWFFDKSRSTMEVRIIGVQLIYEKENPATGEILPTPLCWIYFPEARQVLAQTPVYNRYNDVHRLTYDDFFHKRIFASYITKESNVYDRDINEYLMGMDALLEAERIKNEIFRFEHDLWEY